MKVGQLTGLLGNNTTGMVYCPKLVPVSIFMTSSSDSCKVPL